MNHRVLTLVAIGAVLFAPTAARPAPALAARPQLPARAVPAYFVSADRAAGGRIVYGPLGAQPSEAAAFRAGLRRADLYFGKTLSLLSALRSSAGPVPATMGLFRATLRGTPVAGLAVTAVDPHGGPRLMLFFDDATRIATTLPDLLAAARHAAAPGAGGSAASSGSMRTVAAHDRTLSLSVPADWTVASMGEGQYSVKGPDDATVDTFSVIVGQPGGVIRGMASAPYVAEPAQAFVAVRRAMALQHGDPDPQTHVERVTPLHLPSGGPPGARAARVAGTLTRGTSLRRFDGVVSVVPPTQPGGAWLLGLFSFCSAPAERFRSDAPLMVAIAGSYRPDGAAIRAGQKASIAQINATTQKMLADSARRQAAQNARFDASMASARAAQDSIDRSTAGFLGYLNDTAVVNHEPTGVHQTFTAATAQGMVAANPQRYSIVPMSQYVKGVDY